jgi:electron transport complex protein RnfD
MVLSAPTQRSTRHIMLLAIGFLIPGALVQMAFFGVAVALNLLITVLAVLACEALCLYLIREPSASIREPSAAEHPPAYRLPDRLLDGSALVTACLLALALPPDVPWPVLLIAAIAAVGIGKYAYGGLGNNIFNPAMVGYAIVLVSFPKLMGWPTNVDTLSGATVLTTFKFRTGTTVEDIWTPLNGFGSIAGAQWEWINVAFLLGGLALVAWRLIAWRIPLAMLATIGILAAFGYDNASSNSLGSPFFHWFSGGTMLAAFFVATDPVTHPVSTRGQWLFGIVVGAMTFCVRAFGNYPDGTAFAILLANAITPYVDRRWGLPSSSSGTANG